MTNKLVQMVLLSLIGMIWPGAIAAQTVREVLENTTVKVISYEGQSLVTFGSGFIFHKDGFIGTNFHVVKDALNKGQQVVVEFENKKERRAAEIKTWDDFIDFAVLKVEKIGNQDYPTIGIADSARIKYLDTLYVAGYPVSGVYKTQRGDINSIQSFSGKKYFDISVLIDGGNSGGPIVDTEGRLIGISVAYVKYARSMNLAIQSNDVSDIIQESLRGRRKQLIQEKELESNNCRYAANFLLRGLVIKGHLGEASTSAEKKLDKEDWFELNGQESRCPTFILEHDKNCDFDFEVYSDFNVAGKATGTQKIISCNLPGRCLVKVSHVSGKGDYTLAVTPRTTVGGAEIEPNNVMTMANIIPRTETSFQGRLDAKDTEDWFELSGQEGTNPWVTIVHDRNCNFDFEVYNNNVLVGRATEPLTTDSIQCNVPGSCYIRVWRVSGAGNYTIQVYNASDQNTAQPSPYIPERGQEPNNERQQATYIQRMVIRDQLDEYDSVDWFALNGQEGDYPNFTLVHEAGSNFDFEVYSDQNLIGRANSTTGQDTFSGHVPGRCYLRVWRVSGSGSYTILIARGQPGPMPAESQSNTGAETEPNNSRATANKTNLRLIQGSLNQGDQEDWFILGGQQGSNPTFTITHDAGCDFDFDVYDNDTLVASATGTNPQDSISCRVQGKCFIRVYRVAGNGNYQIRF